MSALVIITLIILPPGTPVEFLSLLGNFTVQTPEGCPNTPTIVAPSHPAMAGLTDAGLSNWDLCSMQESFTSFPSTFTVLVTETGRPYIIAKTVIAGPSAVWYFNRENPTGYDTSISLTSSGDPSTTWTVTAGVDKVNLSTNTGSETVVTSTGTAFSSAVGDIRITATVGGAISDAFAITSRTPDRLAAGSIVHQCDPDYGYSDSLNYTIQDQLLTALPSDVPLNERWSTAVANDFTGTNWRRGPQGSITSTAAAFFDFIQGELLTLPPVPIPVCVGDATAVQHWGQEWRIGSLSIGAGRRVQIDTFQKFRNHAEHQPIVSPAP